MLCAHCTEDLPDGTSSCTACGASPLLEGLYRLERVVGHGAHGTTYRATRLSDDRTVAIKELLVRKVESLKAIELFEREARVLEELDHDGVPEFIDELTVDAGRSVALYLVQEFVDGHTLADEFDGARGTPHEVFELAAELLDTLAYLHELSPPVVHRDIKPGNVMRRASDGRLVLIDFGSVRDAIDTAEGGSTVAGTFGYMAPEQFMGRALPATDIYGVGATIVALLARVDPQKFVGPDRTIDWEPHFDLPPALGHILGEMLEPNVEERPSDARRLAERIRAAVRGEWEPSAASPAAPGESTDVASVSVADVPPKPREIPDGFRKSYAAQHKFNMMFGGIFGLVGLIAGIAGVSAGSAGGDLIATLMPFFFLFVFGGIGGAVMMKGVRANDAAKRIFRDGDATVARISEVGKSNYRVNNKAANVYTFKYEVNGRVQTSDHHLWEELDLVPGDEVVVLYDPQKPNEGLIYDPRQYEFVVREERRAVRRQVVRATEEEVVFDLDEEAGGAEVAQATEVEEEQPSGHW